jgi:hypothetical protein
MEFRAVVKVKDVGLRFGEVFRINKDAATLVLDFDAFKERVASSDYLKITDELHTVVSDAFEASIKEPVIDYMRQNRKAEDVG